MSNRTREYPTEEKSKTALVEPLLIMGYNQVYRFTQYRQRHASEGWLEFQDVQTCIGMPAGTAPSSGRRQFLRQVQICSRHICDRPFLHGDQAHRRAAWRRMQ